MMGGDNGLESSIEGLVMSFTNINKGIKFVLFGNKKDIISNIEKFKNLFNYNEHIEKLEIIDCVNNISMSDDPYSFKELTDSSIVKGLKYLNDGYIDTFLSAGNTGAIYVSSIDIIGIEKDISKPALVSIIPKSKHKFAVLLDVGSNVNCKSNDLFDFAKLGVKFAEKIGINKPSVGLLNIGSEEGKGNSLTKNAFKLLKHFPNFKGNIEGGDILNDKADVYVCDGFTGNIILKLCESLDKIGLNRFNYEYYGGMPILGLNKTVFVGHGKSSPFAFKNMILSAIKY